MLALSPGLSAAGDINVLSGGAPAGGATVSIETLGGETLASTQTDVNGIAKADIPQRAAGQPVRYSVRDKAGNVSRNFVAKPSKLTAMDTDGGVVSYGEESYGHLRKAKEPVTVGANGEVGCGAKLKDKVAETVGGVLGGFLGGGGGGGGSGFSGLPGLGGGAPDRGAGNRGGKDIETEPDPIADDAKRVFADPATGTRIAVGTQLTPEGLQVSTKILDAPCDGTFQSVYLMDAHGNKAGPIRYAVYELYQDWWLKVHWTFDRWEGNRHVEHKEGGWSDEGRNILGTFVVPVGRDGIWNKMGFSNAVEGIKSLGTFFPVGREVFASQPMTLVVHVVNADADPVTTTPFVIGLATQLKQADTIPLFPGANTDFSSPLISEQVSIANELTRLRAELSSAELYGPAGLAESLRHQITEVGNRLRAIQGGEAGGEARTASNVHDAKTAAKIDDLLGKIKKKKSELDRARKAQAGNLRYSRAYAERLDNDMWAATGGAYDSVAELKDDIAIMDARIKRLEGELKDLENELKRLDPGGIESVIDHLEPIAIVS